MDPLTSALLLNIAAAATWDGGKWLVRVLKEWRTSDYDALSQMLGRRFDANLPPDLLERFFGGDCLVDLVRTDPEAAAGAFDEELRNCGITVESPELLLSAAIAGVASADTQLAAELHQADVIGRLDELRSGSGAALGEILDAILDVRSRLQPDDRRTQLLGVLLAESEARVRQLFVALGVEASVAAELADDWAVGRDVAIADGDVVVAAAVAGSGKSLTALRTHQVNLVEAVLSDEAPLPSFVDARESWNGPLSAEIIQRLEGIGDPREVGVRLVIDGLDEMDRRDAQHLVNDASILAAAWPRSAVVAFGRPDVPYNGARTVRLEPPTVQTLDAIVELIVGRSHPFWGLSPALRKAVELPLYAVAAAVLLSRKRELPQSRARLIHDLIQLCMKDADVPDEMILRRLAVARIHGDDVHEGLLGVALAGKLKESRLVVEEAQGELRFSVPIYEDWFAAQALLLDEVEPDTLGRGADAFSRWRHAVSLALATGSPSQVDRLATLVASQVSLGLRLVVDDATVQPFGSDGASPQGDAVGRIQACLEAAYAVFEAPLRTVGSWSVAPSEAEVAVVGAWAEVALRNGEGDRLRRLGTSIAAKEPAWPWKLATDQVCKELDWVLDNRLLPSDDATARREAIWAAARALTNDSSLSHRSIDPEQILELLPPLDDLAPDEPLAIQVPRRPLWVRRQDLFDLVAEAERAISASEKLSRPWPCPDALDRRTGWVDDLYNPHTAAHFARAIHVAALEIYTSLVEDWFTAEADFFGLYATLPVQQLCFYMPRQEGSFAATFEAIWIPLPSGATSRVSIAVLERSPELLLSSHSGLLFDSSTAWAGVGRTPPPFTRAFSTTHQAMRGLGSDRPATHLAYRWLISDLQALGWRDSMQKFDDPD